MSGEERSEAPRMGRPPKLVESEELLKQIEGLARIQCTQREAAAVLRVDEDTFNKFLGSHEKARAVWKDALQTGKASLRRLQYKSAENGNTSMQIWLGKQWLDQKDKSDVDMNATVKVAHEDALNLLEQAASGEGTDHSLEAYDRIFHVVPPN